tara:strand:+ start:301 stop:516 length:216 start_codon:yes stop_codon:yes gene_type:complete
MRQTQKTWRVQRKADLRYNYFDTREDMQGFMKRQRNQWGERFSRVQKLDSKYNHYRTYYHTRWNRAVKGGE